MQKMVCKPSKGGGEADAGGAGGGNIFAKKGNCKDCGKPKLWAGDEECEHVKIGKHESFVEKTYAVNDANASAAGDGESAEMKAHMFQWTVPLVLSIATDSSTSASINSSW